MATLIHIKNSGAYGGPPTWVPKHMREKIQELNKALNMLPAVSRTQDCYSFIDLISEDNFDKEIMALANETEKTRLFDKKHPYLSDLELYALLKAKKFRMDFDKYRQLRDRINEVLNENN